MTGIGRSENDHLLWSASSAEAGMRFFLIDRITRWEVGSAAEGLKNVSLSEDFFDDHFPRHPVMPGVLILEGMAQLSGLLLEESLAEKHGRSAKAVLTILERTKFRQMVRPGETLTYRTEIAALQETGGKVRARAFRNGELVTTTDMVFAFQEVQDPKLDATRRALLDMWRREPPEIEAEGSGPEGGDCHGSDPARGGSP